MPPFKGVLFNNYAASPFSSLDETWKSFTIGSLDCKTGTLMYYASIREQDEWEH